MPTLPPARDNYNTIEVTASIGDSQGKNYVNSDYKQAGQKLGPNPGLK